MTAESPLPEPDPDSAPGADALAVLIPTFNDWDALRLLLPILDRALAHYRGPVHVVLVDDGSTIPAPAELSGEPLTSIDRIEILALRRNVGHQRAIAIGLCHIEARVPCRAVVVMDGDGEDSPDHIARLEERMSETGDTKVIFAERSRRSESTTFRAFYHLYRWTHVLLTGIRVRVGSFSIVPRGQLRRLVVVSDLWNHFSAAIHKANIAFDAIPCARARRLTGESKMNFVSLVGHGLSAMSVFGDRIGARMLIASAGLVGISLVALGVSTVAFGSSGHSLAAWEVYAAGLLLLIFLQALLFSLVFAFIVLASRNMSGFIPARDYEYLIESRRTVYPRDE